MLGNKDINNLQEWEQVYDPNPLSDAATFFFPDSFKDCRSLSMEEKHCDIHISILRSHVYIIIHLSNFL